jgi:hypothetical protein
VGALLLALGVLSLLVGLVLSYSCAKSAYGYCIDYAGSGAGFGFLVMSFFLLLGGTALIRSQGAGPGRIGPDVMAMQRSGVQFPPVSSDSPAVPPNMGIVCPQCGMRNGSASEYCSHCGKRVPSLVAQGSRDSG